MNKDNIQKVIDWIKQDNAKHFLMADFSGFLNAEIVPEEAKTPCESPKRYIECNTVFCIAGYINYLRLIDNGIDPSKIDDLHRQVNDEAAAARWLGIEPCMGHNLFFLENSMGWLRDEFDGLPQEVRAKAAISVLERLRDRGEVNWDFALQEAGLENSFMIFE